MSAQPPMSNHYGDFHVLWTDSGVEINSVANLERWILMDYDAFFAMVRDYADLAAAQHGKEA